LQPNSLASLTADQKARLVDSLTDEEAAQLLYAWDQWARPNQLEPGGEWFGWLVLAGRGFGKTRMGAEWVRANVEDNRAGRIALIAETSADGRDVIVEGESGILAISPAWNRPKYESSKRRLTWPNGATATLYDAREPDQLRGPQHDLAWLDELAKYRYGQLVYDNLMFGLRLGQRPRWMATTTPRPTELIKRLVVDPGVHTTKGRTRDNLPNLAPNFQQSVIRRYEGTRLGRQELDAEILSDTPGALWIRPKVETLRCDAPKGLKRIVVGVDPAITSGDGSNETGIVVCGIDDKNNGYVLDDWTVRGTPEEWARKVISAYRRWEADRIVAEVNQGGDLVEAVIRTVDPSAPVTKVRASRGKFTRAEPISALYEQDRIKHCGVFIELEDQMFGFTPERAAERADGYSPDRVDAMVWAFTELFPDITQRVDAGSAAKRALMARFSSSSPGSWQGR
jgi:phage terminase large subunit-like protein